MNPIFQFAALASLTAWLVFSERFIHSGPVFTLNIVQPQKKSTDYFHFSSFFFAVGLTAGRNGLLTRR
jgi:hypothetical protein